MWLIPEPLVLVPLLIDQQFWEVVEDRAVNDGAQWKFSLTKFMLIPPLSVTIMVMSVPENTADELRYDKKESYCHFCSLHYHYLKIVED